MAETDLIQAKAQYRTTTYDSLEPLNRKTTAGSTSGYSPSNNENISATGLNLNNRKQRLSIWIVAYFIFVIAELTANSIEHRPASHSLKQAYSLFIASDTFLFLGCALIWFPMASSLDAAGFLYIDYFKYISGFCFILSCILQWPAVRGLSNDICNDNYTGTKSYCRSYIFASHWMGHFFALCTGIDILDLKSVKYNDKRTRMFVYALNLFLMYVILGTDIDYFYRGYALTDGEKSRRNALESGYFIVALCCAFILILIVMHFCDPQYRCTPLVVFKSFAFKNVFGLCLLIGTGLMFSSIEVMVSGAYEINTYGNLVYNLVLSTVPLVMIVYDIYSYNSSRDGF